MVAVVHHFREWQANLTSSPDLVYNDRCIQGGVQSAMGNAQMGVGQTMNAANT